MRSAWSSRNSGAHSPTVSTCASAGQPSSASNALQTFLGGSYVNDFTRDLGDEGYAAITALLDRAHAAGTAAA